MFQPDIFMHKQFPIPLRRHSSSGTWISSGEKVYLLNIGILTLLAKLATTLPLPPYTPTFPTTISLGGNEAPTTAKKWIAAVHPYAIHPGVHWVTWLPLRARRRHLWLQWLPGNVCWQGCSPPWEK